MKKIIFLQAKLPSDKHALKQVTVRWNSYGGALEKRDPNAGIWVFTPRPFDLELDSNHELVHLHHFSSVECLKGPLRRVNALVREIRINKERVLLVCGDNQTSLLVALYVSFRLRSLVGIQIQFHGDTYSLKANHGMKGFVRVLLSRLGIYFADSIRIVSSFQSRELIAISKKVASKLVLAPIPIDQTKIATVASEKVFDLTFIGRLHQERGVDDFLEIVTSLKRLSPKTSIAIAGVGPMKNEIENRLASWITDSSVSMLGFLKGQEIPDLYAATKVVISTAPSEGYGLTLRESVLSNTPVVARKSAGSLEAQYLFPMAISTYDNVEQAVGLILEKLGSGKSDFHAQYLSSQLKTDTEGTGRLVDSWLKY